MHFSSPPLYLLGTILGDGRRGKCKYPPMGNIKATKVDQTRRVVDGGGGRWLMMKMTMMMREEEVSL